MQHFNRINFWGKGFYYLLLLCAFFGFFTKTASAATGINHTINFQGKLVNSDGTNVTNGSYSIVFSLYTVSSGGTAAWTETDSVTATDGVFRVSLGGSTTFSSAGIDFNSDTYYLGIKVGSDAEMTPRVQFSAVPYAFNAEKVNGLTVTNNGGNTLNIAANKTLTANSSLTLAGTDGKSLTVNGSTTLADNVITFGGTETLTLAATKNVSFADAFTTSGANPLTLTTTGTTNATLPSGTITLADLTTAQTFTNKIIGSTGLTFTGATTDITTGTNEDFVLKPNGTGKIGLFTTGTLGSTFDLRANSGTLSIASIAGTTSFAGLVVDNSSGPLFTASTGGVPKFTIGNNGSITASNYAGANAVLYAAPTTGLFTAATTTTGSQCLTSQSGTSGVPTWGSCGSGTNFWQQTTSGSFTYVSPNPITQLVSIGQTTGLTASGLSVKVDSLGNAAGYIENAGTGDIFTASSAGTTKFVIDKNGNVGINTAAPTANLMVSGRSTNQDASILLQASGSTNISKLIFGDSSALRWEFGNSTTDQFYIYDDTNNATRFSINGQSVDIGSGTPLTSTGLHVGVDSKGNATQVVDSLGGLGDIFTASSAGVSKFTIDKSGNVVLGADNTTPGAVTIRGAQASGTNIAGGNLTFDASNGTGSGGSGDLIFRTAAAAGGSTNTVTIDHTTDYDTGGSLVASKAVSFTVNSQSNNIIILSASINSSSHTISTVSDSVNGSFTKAAGTTNGSVYTSIWYLKGPSVGAHTITITPSASDTIIGSVSQVYNVDQTTPVGTAVTNTGSGTSTSVVVTSTNTTQLVYDTVANPGGGTFSAPLGTSIYNHFAANSSQVAGSTIAGSNTSTTLGWTISGTQSWVDIGIPINPSVSAGSSTTADTLTDRFHITDTGLIGVNSAVPNATFDVRANSATIPIASLSGSTNFAGLLVDNSGSGDLLTASSSGMTRFRIGNNGSILIQGDIISASGSGAINGSNTFTNALGDQGSLIPNAGFESAQSGQTFADGWIASATNSATITRDTSAFAKGGASLKVASTGTNQVAAFYSTCVPLAGAGSYNFYYYQKGSSANIATVRGYIDQYTTKSNCQTNTSPLVTASAGTTAVTNAFASVGNATAYTGASNGWSTTTTWGRAHFFVSIPANGNSVNIDGVRLVESSLTVGVDYAENYPADPVHIPQPGDVVSLESINGVTSVKPADKAMDDSVIGVVSTNPGQVLDDGSMSDPKVPIALSGRIPTKVSTKNGAIHIGDYLTSSDIPGVAVKAISAGPVIGTAMEDYDGKTCGKEIAASSTTPRNDVCSIVMFVKNSYYPGYTALTMSADKIQANQVEGLDIITNQVAQLSNQVASLSAKLSVLGASTSATDVTINPNVIASDSAAISGLIINNDATISGKLRVKGSGLFEGILSVIDTLKANDFMATGIAEFFNTAIFHNDVSFEGKPTFNADTAGFALIKKGSDHIDITFDKPYQATPVINATLSVTSASVTPTPINGKTLEQRLLAEGYYYIVTKQSPKGFTILLNKQASEDVQFSWSALSIKDVKLFQTGGLTPTPTVSLSTSSGLSATPTDFLLNPEATGPGE